MSSSLRSSVLVLNIMIIIIEINCNQTLTLLATQHFNRVLREAKCQTPVRRVIDVQELFPSAHKKYVPHCTVLHFCGYETGCCRHENQRCVPKSVSDVDLYFFTIELTPDGQRRSVELITMKNHTECMCQLINDTPRV